MIEIQTKEDPEQAALMLNSWDWSWPSVHQKPACLGCPIMPAHARTRLADHPLQDTWMKLIDVNGMVP